MDAIRPYSYATYVRATPEEVWAALTDPDATQRFWGHRNEAVWEVGQTWRHIRTDEGGEKVTDVIGEVRAVQFPHRLAMTFDSPETYPSQHSSCVSFDLVPGEGIVRLTVTHEALGTQADRDEIAVGWPCVMANLKTYLETGRTLPQNPWEMPKPGAIA